MGVNLLLSRIEAAMNAGSLSHAFIVSGSNRDLRNDFAAKAAAILLGSAGQNLDLLTVEPDGASIKTEQIIELCTALKSKPFLAERMVAIIYDADVMTTQSQNKLLKTLEEPSGGSVLMLLSENPERLIATIRSRCVALRLDEMADMRVRDEAREEVLADARRAVSVAAQHTKPLAEMFDCCDKYSSDAASATEFLGSMEGFLRDMVVGIRNNELIADSANKEIVSRLSGNSDKTFRNTIRMIEDTRRDIGFGMNIKYCLRDLGVKIRQEGFYGTGS